MLSPASTKPFTLGADAGRNARPVCTFILALGCLTASCSPTPTPTLFRAPSPAPRTSEAAGETAPPPTRMQPTAGTLETESALPCTNDLAFVQDSTVPDGSLVPAGSTIDKQWLVTNSGTCDWDAAYRLKFMGGDLMGAAQEQALYPARAGTQATLRIVFTAPQAAGTYQSQWQAFGPDGLPFGQPVFTQVVVAG